MAEQQKLACNRKPFESDSSCDRGDVNTELFIDFPICDPIDPTIPDSASITVDFPVVPFSPPPCACAKVEFASEGHIEDREDIYLYINFEAIGDCCEGNYRTDVDIRIPCFPFDVDDKEHKKDITINNVHCDEPTGEVSIRLIAEDCRLSIEPNIELNLPCMPFETIEKTSKVTINQVECGTEPNGTFTLKLEQDCETCEITFEPELELNIPDPPEYHFNDGGVNIDYDCNSPEGTLTWEEDDESSGCDRIFTPQLDLTLDCIPFEISDTPAAVDIDTVCAETGDETASGTIKVSVSEDCCLLTLEPELSLTIPVPPIYSFETGTVTITPACSYSGSIKFKVDGQGDDSSGSGGSGLCKKKVIPELELKIKKIPFGINNTTKNHPVALKRVQQGEASLNTNVTSDCNNITFDPLLDITVPCALDGLKMVSESQGLKISVGAKQTCDTTYKFKLNGLTSAVHYLAGIKFNGSCFEPIVGTMEFKDGLLICASDIPVCADIPVVRHENKCCGGDDAPEEGDILEDQGQAWPWLY